MRRIAIHVLGPFAVTIDGAPVTAFDYAKVRALLTYLAVESHRPLPRAELATLLWPDQPERAARASLSQALTTLRNALGEKNAEQPVLLSDVQNVQLNLAGFVDVDVVSFLALLRASDAHTHRSWQTCSACSERLRQALNLYRGSFLADLAIPDSDVFQEWASLQREHLLQQALSALERLVERSHWRGAFAEAVAYARQLVALEPLLEMNHRAYLRALALNGQTAAALAHYRRLRTLLAHELGVTPEQDTRALFDQIRTGDTVGLQPPRPPFAVPLAPTPLVGRGDELQAICGRLQDLSARAVTITGTGGIGKTRLALEAAHALRYDFEDGVFFVELAALSDAALVPDAIAYALEVKERPGRRLAEALREHLRAKQLLLVLDNFEHVVAAAPFVSELLAACPGLTVLVTSRAPLNIRAEHTFVLEPLADADATQLFVQRAQAAGAGLDANEASATVFAAICRRVDRLPLAIELIAVRARTLSPFELLRQLERPLQALARGSRDMSPRHQSLRHAIQWSYDLLDPDEQRVFRSLGAFAGGCVAEAAQAVCGDPSSALLTLESLHQASLVQQQTVAEETRFVLLETIREFALEQLARHGEVELVRQRHAEHFARFSATASVELLRAEAPRWRALVAAESDNLREAFRWALERQHYETALLVATGVWRFHWMSGSLSEGLERLEVALVFRDQASADVRCNALRAAGILAMGLNDYPRARRWLEAGVEEGWRLGDPDALQRILTNLGFVLLEQGELDDARIYLEVSLSLAQRSADPIVVKFPLGILASLHLQLGDYATAQAMCEESLRINQACGDTEGTANALRSLATIINARGDRLRAAELGQQALALHRSLDHQLGMGLDYALFGDIAHAQGDYTQALARYQQCLSLWRDRDTIVNSVFVLDSIASVLSQAGDPELAATLVGAAAAVRERASVKLTARQQASRDSILLACRLALGEARLQAAQRAGRALSLAQAIDLALSPAVATTAISLLAGSFPLAERKTA